MRPNNDYFRVLDKLVQDGMIFDEVSLVWEGVPDIPKFFCSLP